MMIPLNGHEPLVRVPALVRGAGLTLIVLAVVVMFGWFAHLSVLTQVVPTFAPMQFNTATGFLLCGTGLIGLSYRKPRLLTVAAALAVLLGGATLLEYLLGTNFGIDTLVVDPFTAVKTSHVGRMAPNTALAFVLAGTTLLLTRLPLIRRPAAPSVLLALAAGVFGMGMLSLTGYILGIESAMGWAHLTRMALHTSVGFVITGFGLFFGVLGLRPLPEGGAALPVAGGLVTALFTLAMWMVLESDQQRRLGELLQARAQTYAAILEESLTSEARTLQRMADRLATGLSVDDVGWSAEAGSYVVHADNLMALVLADGEAQRYVWRSARAKVPGYDVVGPWLDAGEGGVSLAVTGDAYGRPVLVLAAPIGPGASRQLIAFFDLPDRLNGLQRQLGDPLGRRVWLNGRLVDEQVVPQSGGVYGRLYSELGSAVVRVFDHPIVVQQVATRAFIDLRRSSTAYVVLISGLALTIMTSAVLALLQYTVAQNRRIRAKQEDLQRQIGISRQLQTNLELSNQNLEEFAYVASHDLQEPLRGIRSYSRFLIEDNADQLDDMARQRLETIMTLAERLGNLINDLLTYSRVGRVDDAVVPVDLDQVVTDVMLTLHHQMEARGAELVRPQPLPTYVCDQARIAEVYRNLIENALKYNDSDGPRIEVGVRADTQPPQFYVRDNGIGIPEEAREKVFRIFTRLHHRDQYGGGTGAGLTIVQKIIQHHGGRIWVEDAPDGGSVFVFTLEPAPEQ